MITLPTVFRPRSCSLKMSVNQRVAASPFGGSEQAIDLMNDRWLMSVEVHVAKSDSAAIEAFIGAIRGQTQTVALWHFARPYIAGTLTVTSGSLTASGSQGSNQLVMSATGLTGTILAGDMIGVGGLLFMAAADATASDNSITVPITNRVRVSVSGSVTLIKPTTLFRLLNTSDVAYIPGQTNPVTFDFGEVITSTADLSYGYVLTKTLPTLTVPVPSVSVEVTTP